MWVSAVVVASAGVLAFALLPARPVGEEEPSEDAVVCTRRQHPCPVAGELSSVTTADNAR